MATIGQKIQTMRLSRGITQLELASEIEVSRSLISLWEKDLRMPQFEELEALADFFNVDIATFRNEAPLSYKYTELNTQEKRLIELFRSLNNNGKDSLLKSAEMHSLMPDFKEESPRRNAL